MYLLPVTTYFDYLRASKKWTVYTGGTVLLSIMLGTSQNDKVNLPIQSASSVRLQSIQGINRFSPGIAKSQSVLADNKEQVEQTPMQEVITYEEKFILVDEEIPCESEQRVDPQLQPGQIKVVNQGSVGLKRNVWQLTIIGDQEIKREIVFSQVVSQPIKKIIASNPVRVVASRGQQLPAGIVAQQEFEVESTAYTFSGHNTATGVKPRVGLVAVDPRVIPLGTKLFIEGYGYAVAADTGGAIKGKKVDVFFNTVKECIGWGRRRVKIYILPQ